MGKIFLKTFYSVTLFLLVILFAGSALAESKFRSDFSASYRQNRFDALAYLVKANKDIMPGEVRSLIEEASSPDKPFQEKMDLLDIASAMASMYKEWHNDGSLIPLVEAVQKEEMRKEKERVAELEKWNAYETVQGNLVLKEHEKEQAAKGLNPVIFPHWIHRLTYDCKACHQGLFTMKRNANRITHSAFSGGKQCGACHDGKVSFSSNEKCERCHAAGKPEADELDPKKAGLNKLSETAARTGSVWRPEALKEGKLPLDRFGQIDWGGLERANAYEASKTDTKEGIKDNRIFFEPVVPYIKGVTFDHKVHSTHSGCSVCHPDLFKDALGANKVSMTEMSKGNFCGACHGKVSFRFADCARCHKGSAEDGALIRKGTFPEKK